MNLFVWWIKAILGLSIVVASVISLNVVTGTNLAQQKADQLHTAGYKVTVSSPKGAPRITPKIVAAPEIDAASGAIALSLLTGIVLLMKESSRSRQSSKSDV